MATYRCSSHKLPLRLRTYFTSSIGPRAASKSHGMRGISVGLLQNATVTMPLAIFLRRLEEFQKLELKKRMCCSKSPWISYHSQSTMDDKLPAIFDVVSLAKFPLGESIVTSSHLCIGISSAWFLESWGARHLNVARSLSKLKNLPACMLVNAVERRKCAASKDSSELLVDKSDDSVVVSVVEGSTTVSENQEPVPVDQVALKTQGCGRLGLR
ncbi:hypothetical protein SELMODRAFT_406610 [Selaginella moellendorffii]|uniref:Uncharacterized protein n=1 Tax=Selaginella moellendorffii TaxID=88036 RepID=D8R0W7_SELML|nr:hypothetical protein SELMODRAFT_406610 [Selaginella moellendorffii]